MAVRLVFASCALLLAAGVAVPALAGEPEQSGDSCYSCIGDSIYENTNLIAGLEANPDVDEAVKGPAITAARVEIHRLHAKLGPAEWRWPTPCCYSRKPLYIH